MRRITYPPSTIIKLPNIFGDGSDGDVTISVNTTLTRDMLYRNLTINAGVILITAGYRIFVSNTFRNLGTIHNHGAPGVGANGGQDVSSNAVSVPPASAGGNGSAAVAPGTAGVNLNLGLGGTIMNGGTGGAAGASAGGAGGNFQAFNVVKEMFFNIVDALSLRSFRPGSTWQWVGAGTGGGGGGNASGAGTVSGGGGEGGGTVLISAKTLDNSAGIIEVDGGTGGAATGAGNAGGGGGGGGGIVSLIYLSIATGIERASGGAGGAKVGTGSVGTNGNAGQILKVPGI